MHVDIGSCGRLDAIYLVPRTPLSDQLAKRYVRGNDVGYLKNAEPIGSYLRAATCDRDNSFVFEGLPPGRYYLMAYLSRPRHVGLTLVHFDYRAVRSLDLGPGQVRDLGTMHID